MTLGDVMGRELKRKNKKQGIEVETTSNEEEVEVKKILKVLLFVLGVLVIAYLLVGIFITKEIKLDWFNKKNSVDINPSYLLASETFNQKEDTYYVYFYDFDNYNAQIESKIVSKLSNDRIYRVDLGSAFNNNYLSDNGNASASNKEELKVNSITLIKVENGSNAGYYEGEEAINSFLNN